MGVNGREGEEIGRGNAKNHIVLWDETSFWRESPSRRSNLPRSPCETPPNGYPGDSLGDLGTLSRGSLGGPPWKPLGGTPGTHQRTPGTGASIGG